MSDELGEVGAGRTQWPSVEEAKARMARLITSALEELVVGVKSVPEQVEEWNAQDIEARLKRAEWLLGYPLPPEEVADVQFACHAVPGGDLELHVNIRLMHDIESVHMTATVG